MKKNKNVFQAMFVALVVSCITVGCVGPGGPISRPGSAGGDGGIEGWQLSTRDLVDAANNLTDRMLASGRLDRPDDKKHVIAVGTIENRTSQRLSTEILSEQIIQGIDETEKFRASSLGDQLARQLSDLNNSPDVRPGSKIPGSSIEVPHYTLQGKIFEETIRHRGRAEKSYTINIHVNSVQTRTRVWTGNYFLSKFGKGAARTW